MTVVVRKEKRKNGKAYYKLYDVKRVNGKVKSKYVGYLGKDPSSKNEISYGEMMQYVHRLMDIEICDSDIHNILKKIGIESNITPITKIILENDRKLKKTFLRIK